MQIIKLMNQEGKLHYYHKKADFKMKEYNQKSRRNFTMTAQSVHQGIIITVNYK